MKDKDIREYLHYYIGCECWVQGQIEENPIKLTGISWDDQTGEWWCYFENTETAYALIEDVAPLLYRLEDINYAQLLAVAQADNYYKFNSWDEAVETEKNIIKSGEYRPQTFHKLISMGFWMWGNDWFDEGYIIDKKTLNNG